MNHRILIDFGSHSIKVYQYLSGAEALELVDTLTWRALENFNDWESIHHFLSKIVDSFPKSLYKIEAMGTAAVRRCGKMAQQVQQACSRYDIHFEIISQEKEADLIRAAFEGYAVKNVVNVGGGSIQIVSAHQSTPTLYSFGISDLVRQFSLDAESPLERQRTKCLEFLNEKISTMEGSFVYSGGEFSYLTRCGVSMNGNQCLSSDFKKLVDQFSQMRMSEILQLSPYDPQWMLGAIASNSIVEVLLMKSLQEYFYASDLNIAHGLCKSYLGGV